MGCLSFWGQLLFYTILLFLLHYFRLGASNLKRSLLLVLVKLEGNILERIEIVVSLFGLKHEELSRPSHCNLCPNCTWSLLGLSKQVIAMCVKLCMNLNGTLD